MCHSEATFSLVSTLAAKTRYPLCVSRIIAAALSVRKSSTEDIRLVPCTIHPMRHMLSCLGTLFWAQDGVGPSVLLCPSLPPIFSCQESSSLIGLNLEVKIWLPLTVGWTVSLQNVDLEGPPRERPSKCEFT